MADVTCAGGDGAIHAYAVVIGAVPLTPAIVFAGLDVGAVVAAGDVGQGLEAERAGVAFIRGPALHQHFCDGADDGRIGRDGLARPLVGDLFGGEIRVPRETAEGVEVGEGERRAEPCLLADAGDADHAAESDDGKDWPARICLTGVDAPSNAHVEVEDLFPHGREVDEMALLAGVLLRDLEFHGLAGLREAAEERRDGFARLEVDGAFLGLDDDVRGELAVERMEDVVSGASAVGFGVAPVSVMVVDEGAIEDDSAVRRERSGEGVGGICGSAAKAGGAGLAFASRL